MDKTRRFFFTVILVLCSFPGSAQETGEAANRNRAAETLREWAPDGNFIMEEHSLLENTGGFGTSLLARIPGAGGSGGTFALAVPLYGDFAVDAGLAFVKAALERTHEAEILAAFLADEKTELPADAGGAFHKGLHELLSAIDMPENWALCYLDLEDAPEGIIIKHGDGEYLAPLEFVQPLIKISRAHNIYSDFEIRYNEFHKLELANRSPELAMAWEAEVNAITLGPAQRSGAEKINPESLAEMLLDYADTFVFPIQNPDRHYNFFHAAGFTVFAGEKTSVQILVAFTGILVFLTLVYFTRWRRRIFFRRFGIKFFLEFSWVFVLFLPVLTLAIKGSGFFYVSLLSVLGKPVPGADYPGMILVTGLGLILFAFLLQLPDYYTAIKGNFYGLSALFLSTIGLFTSIFLDLTYAPIFVWISFFCFAGLLSTRTPVVFVSAFFIPIHAAGAFVNLWRIGAQSLPDILFSPGGSRSWMACLQISLILLPAMLLFKKGLMNFKKQKNAGVLFSRTLRIGIPVFAVLLLLIYVIAIPGKSPPPVRRSLEDRGSLLAVAFEDTVFEESRILGINVRAVYPPARFDIVIESSNGERPLVYSAPAPLEEKGEGILAVMLGENPPNPFSTELVLSSGFSGSVRIEALYTDAQTAEAIDPEFTPEENYLLRLWNERRITAAASGSRGLRPNQN